MAHLYRFHVPAEQLRVGRVMLPKDEAHHASRVARLPEGETVELFSGDGRLGRGVIAEMGRNAVAVEVGTVEEAVRQGKSIILMVAWPNHGKCTEEIVRRATEFEVERVVFFRGENSERGPLIKDKFARVAIEAAKQCGAVWLPVLEVAGSFAEALDGFDGDVTVAHMESNAPVATETSTSSGTIALVIGPEGGFTDAELQLARERGARFLSLGPNTLRTEVAVCAGLALVVGEAWRS